MRSATPLRLPALLLSVVLLVAFHNACGRESPTGPSKGGTASTVVASVTVSIGTPGLGSLTVGAQTHVTAVERLANEESRNCTDAATWRMSNPAIAAVAPGGVLTGLSPGTTVVNATCDGVTGSAPLTVYESASLSGVVEDEGGAPVAGASIGIRDSKFGRAVSSDANGRYRITGIVRGGSYPLSVRKGGYETISTEVTLPAAETVMDFTLHPGVIVSGRVTESGIGALVGVKVEVVSGVNAGRSDLSTSLSDWSVYRIEHLLPGTFTLRASKQGYESVERMVQALDDITADFELKASYGTCLSSVVPLFFDRFRSAGGEATVSVGANPGRRWTAISDQPWVGLPGGAGGTGPGTVLLRLLPAAAGATDVRAATVRVGCGAAEGQNVRVSQLPDCRTSLAWAPGSPTSFPAAGGIGRVRVRTGTPLCHWQSLSMTDWITVTGVSSWYGDFESAAFEVQPNATGAPRVGTVVIGEKAWEVSQSAQ